MSRSQPNISKNPAVRFMEWNGEKGNLKYYDKTAGEKGENIEVPLPFTFLWLDQTSKVGGWNDAAERSIYSNEVRNISQEALTVRTSGSNIIAQGLYSEIKEKVKSNGGHYIASMYVAFKLDDELVIGNLGLKGAALQSWMEFYRKHQSEIHEKAVKISGFQEGKKGSITFKVPEFEIQEAAQETTDKAIELDKELQKFLASKPDTTVPVANPYDVPEEPAHENTESNNTPADDSDDSDGLPF